MKFVDYYAALGLPRDADLAQIKKAYRTLARQYHPDVSKAANAEAQFKNAATAYATLKNPEKRAAYDALGPLKEGTDLDSAPQGPPGWRESQTTRGEDMDFADFFDNLQRGDPFGTSRGRARAPRRGQDLQDTVNITLEQALQGCSLHLIQTMAGERRELEVSIPPGVWPGQQMRLRGKGGPGLYGADDGDFFLHLGLQTHPRFRQDLTDLYFDLPLSPWEAALGAEVSVPTLESELMLTVPAGSSSGKKLRMRGRGMPNKPGSPTARGDLYALVRIEVPVSLTAQERSAFEALARISTFNPRPLPPGTTP